MAATLCCTHLLEALLLIGLLGHDTFDVRERASQALGRHPCSLPMLYMARKSKDQEVVWRSTVLLENKFKELVRPTFYSAWPWLETFGDEMLIISSTPPPDTENGVFAMTEVTFRWAVGQYVNMALNEGCENTSEYESHRRATVLFFWRLFLNGHDHKDLIRRLDRMVLVEISQRHSMGMPLFTFLKFH